jgi:4-hydroxy-tetrahydrodipicolinate synthase
VSIFQGSAVAIVTPFNPDGSINFEVLERLIGFQFENETDAIVVCGTTGEASTLTDEEQLSVIKFVVDSVKKLNKKLNKSIPVIAGAGSNDTRHGAELAKGAEEMGADALLLVSPYYNKTTQKGLISHYTDHAKAVKIPIIMYNIPGRTGLNINAETVLELSKIDNIAGVKEASGNLAHIMDLMRLCGEKLDVYSGNDDNVIAILALGGKGVISTMANVVPKQTHDIVKLYFDGDQKGALKIQFEMAPLIKALFCEVNPIPVKTALKLKGYAGMSYRKPLVEMEPKNEEFLKKTLADLKLI